MRKGIWLAGGLSLMASAALAQPLPTPDAVQAVSQDWQGVAIAQGHLLASLQGLVNDLQAARVKIEALTAENAKLKNEPTRSPEEGKPSEPPAK